MWWVFGRRAKNTMDGRIMLFKFLWGARRAKAARRQCQTEGFCQTTLLFNGGIQNKRLKQWRSGIFSGMVYDQKRPKTSKRNQNALFLNPLFFTVGEGVWGAPPARPGGQLDFKTHPAIELQNRAPDLQVEREHNSALQGLAGKDSSALQGLVGKGSSSSQGLVGKDWSAIWGGEFGVSKVSWEGLVGLLVKEGLVSLVVEHWVAWSA